MKTKLLLLTLCLALTAELGAATPRRHKPHPSTLPPTAKMIVLPALPPIPIVRDRAAGGSELITTEIGGRDLRFFTTSIETGLSVVSLGELAKSRAESGAIKDVGSALANTQVEENKQLVRLAALKGVTLSTAAPAPLAALTEELSQLTGSNFDKACMDRIIAASKESVASYEGAVASNDSDIKNFSEQMLPISKEKLRLAEKMTGAGARAAKALFRTGAKPTGAPVTPPPPAPAPATPAVAPPRK